MKKEPLTKERARRIAIARGLIPAPEELTDMEKLASFGRGALGDVADMGRAAIGATLSSTLGDGQDDTWMESYEDYKRGADTEERAITAKNTEQANNYRLLGGAAATVAGAGLAGAALRGTGLAKATQAALQRGAAKVGSKLPGATRAAKPRFTAAQVARGEHLGKSAVRSKLKNAAGNAAVGGAVGAVDPDSSVVGGAIDGVIFGGIAGKILGSEKAKALKNLAMNTPIGRMGISQLAKRLGVSSEKAATLWYAMHPTSRRGIERAVAAYSGKED